MVNNKAARIGKRFSKFKAANRGNISAAQLDTVLYTSESHQILPINPHTLMVTPA
jgi:hypothetical protein